MNEGVKCILENKLSSRKKVMKSHVLNDQPDKIKKSVKFV